jgi:hypothetical protein
MRTLLPIFALAFAHLASAGTVYASREKGAFETTLEKSRLSFALGWGVQNGMSAMTTDWTLAYGPVALGFLDLQASPFGSHRMDDEGENTAAVLAGYRHEFGHASLMFRSGVAQVVRTHRVDEAAGDLREYRGYGIPVKLDMEAGGRYVAFNLGATAILDRDGGSLGVTAGVPLGLLRR